MAFAGILNDGDVKAALDSCSGEIFNVSNLSSFKCFISVGSTNGANGVSARVSVFQLPTPSTTRVSSRNAVWPPRATMT